MGSGVKDKKFEYYRGSPKNPIFREGGGHEKPIYRGELPKKGDLDSLQV